MTQAIPMTTTTSPAKQDALFTRAERLARFGEELDALKKRIDAEIGEDDVLYVKRVNRTSRAMEIAGRALIHLSLEPITWSAGVLLLWLHKQLQATEVGHTVLHGAYDRLPGAERYASKTWWWSVPIDEESWRYGHNVRHHGATNVAGKDGDVHFGRVRLTEEVEHRPYHAHQLLFSVLAVFPNFGAAMNVHFTGLNDAYFSDGVGGKPDFLPDQSPASKRLAWKRALRKWVPYYGLEYVALPALAGPFFWKVLLANWLTETMRDVYSAATIFCGHVGESVASYPEGTMPKSKGEWYAMQAEATNDFEVPWAVSVLCGGLDRQIEHHLFPKLAPQRLRQIAPEVREICERHGVRYQTASWPETLKNALSWIDQLSKQRSAKGATRGLIEAMA